MTQTEIILSILEESKPKLLTTREIFDILKTRPKDYNCFNKEEKDQEKRDKQIRAQISSILTGTLVKKGNVRVYKGWKPQKFEFAKQDIPPSGFLDIVGKNLEIGDKILVHIDSEDERKDGIIRFRKALIVNIEKEEGLLCFVCDLDKIRFRSKQGAKEDIILLDDEIARAF